MKAKTAVVIDKRSTLFTNHIVNWGSKSIDKMTTNGGTLT